MEGKKEFVAFRASTDVVDSMKKFAKSKNLTVGELLNISVLTYINEPILLNIEFQRKMLK